VSKRSNNFSAVTTKLPRERAAQLDRLATRRGQTRSALVRAAVETLLDDSEEPIAAGDLAAVRKRRENAEAVRELGAINRKYRRPR
jgi:predicted DNA-binding protein